MEFSNYYSHEAIFTMLCKLRCKIAFKRNKQHFYFDHIKGRQIKPKDEDLFIMSIFPPRRRWLKLKPDLRNHKNKLPKTSAVRNMISLKRTVKYYRETAPSSDFLIRMDRYIQEIQECFRKHRFVLKQPEVIPIIKGTHKTDGSDNICRPMSSYGLTEKILLSIANKYAVDLFDPIFRECGFAFRGKRNIQGEFRAPNHLDAFQKIIDYKSSFQKGVIWGAECDMSKFFDTINHSLVMRRFDQFLKQKYFRQHSQTDLQLLRVILKKYLHSYTFNKYVLSLSRNLDYFKKYRILNGKFDWVGEQLLALGAYRDLNKAKIGIPQGGALSGFIANLLLHDADRNVLEKLGEDSIYLRFCDDMIILSQSKISCEESYRAYIETLSKNKLIIHHHVTPPFEKAGEFWSSKSKLCYRWSDSIDKDTFWIGFVGLEINYHGDVRIRKATLKKELKKQADVMLEMKNILKNKKRMSFPLYVLGSLKKRLISMSVGRVDIWNHKLCSNEMSWSNGFKVVNSNVYSRRQMKNLDRSRNLKIHKLKKFITKNYVDELRMERHGLINTEKRSNLELKHYGKPYSYFHNIISDT